MRREEKGIHYHSETQPAVGEAFNADYVAEYDGLPAIVKGDYGILLPVTVRREGPNQVAAIYRNVVQVMATSRRTLSEAGTVMTITTTSVNTFSQTQTSIGVYRRADAR